MKLKIRKLSNSELIQSKSTKVINRNSFSRRWCHLAAEKELKQHGVHSVTDLLTDQRVCVCCVGGLCVLTFSPSGV